MTWDATGPQVAAPADTGRGRGPSLARVDTSSAGEEGRGQREEAEGKRGQSLQAVGASLHPRGFTREMKGIHPISTSQQSF